VIRIKKEVLDFIVQAARNVYPAEFSGLLRMEGDTITEVIVVPKTNFGHGFSIMEFIHLPITVKYEGSVHSHPSASNKPSKADLAFFSKIGRVHLIIAYPFTKETLAAYDNKGVDKIGKRSR